MKESAHTELLSGHAYKFIFRDEMQGAGRAATFITALVHEDFVARATRWHRATPQFARKMNL